MKSGILSRFLQCFICLWAMVNWDGKGLELLAVVDLAGHSLYSMDEHHLSTLSKVMVHLCFPRWEYAHFPLSLSHPAITIPNPRTSGAGLNPRKMLVTLSTTDQSTNTHPLTYRPARPSQEFKLAVKLIQASQEPKQNEMPCGSLSRMGSHFIPHFVRES